MKHTSFWPQWVILVWSFQQTFAVVTELRDNIVLTKQKKIMKGSGASQRVHSSVDAGVNISWDAEIYQKARGQARWTVEPPHFVIRKTHRRTNSFIYLVDSLLSKFSQPNNSLQSVGYHIFKTLADRTSGDEIWFFIWISIKTGRVNWTVLYLRWIVCVIHLTVCCCFFIQCIALGDCGL